MTTTMNTTLAARRYRNVITWAYGADIIKAVSSTVTASLDAWHERGLSPQDAWERVKWAMEDRHEFSPGVLLMTELAAEMPEDEWKAAARAAILKMTKGRILDAAIMYQMPEPTTDAAALLAWLETGK